MSKKVTVRTGGHYLEDASDPKSLVQVLSITIKDGRVHIHALHLYEDRGNDFHTDVESVSKWVNTNQNEWN